MKINSVGMTPISVGAKKFNDQKVLDAYIRLLDKNFSKGCLLLVDTPKRHNYSVIEGISETEALARIKRQTESLENRLDQNLVNMEVDITRFRELQDDIYERNLDVLNEAFEKHERFYQELTNEWIKPFLQLSITPSKSDIEEAANYLLEELALLTAVSDRPDKLTEVYPEISKLEKKLYDEEYSFANDLVFDREREFWEIDMTEKSHRQPIGISENGLYARRHLYENEELFWLEGPVTYSPGNSSFKIAEETYIQPKNKGRYLEKGTARANVRRVQNRIIAKRYIKPSEELILEE